MYLNGKYCREINESEMLSNMCSSFNIVCFARTLVMCEIFDWYDILNQNFASPSAHRALVKFQ